MMIQNHSSICNKISLIFKLCASHICFNKRIERLYFSCWINLPVFSSIPHERENSLLDLCLGRKFSFIYRHNFDVNSSLRIRRKSESIALTLRNIFLKLKKSIIFASNPTTKHFLNQRKKKTQSVKSLRTSSVIFVTLLEQTLK